MTAEVIREGRAQRLFCFGLGYSARALAVRLQAGGWRVAGTMVIGIALMKLGVFAAARSVRFYAALCVLGYGVGLPIVYLGARALISAGFDFRGASGLV